MPTIKNINEFASIIEAKIKQAVDLTQQEINKVLNLYIDAYYEEYKPKVYIRQYMLRDSPIHPKITINNNTVSCEVGISEEYLKYQYPDTYGEPRTISNIPATGEDILYWNNESGAHGYTRAGKVHIWNDTIKALGGEQGIGALLKRNLIKAGLPIQ